VQETLQADISQTDVLQENVSREEVESIAKVLPVYGATNPDVTESSTGVRYFGSVIELKGEKEKLYRELHADVWEDVLQAIRRANIRNYHIFLSEIQEKKYLFSFFEYHGNDMDHDFATIGEDPTTRDKWWPITDGCQERLPGTPKGQQWMGLESLMHIP
jgi:L-rhamnose mutarotase